VRPVLATGVSGPYAVPYAPFGRIFYCGPPTGAVAAQIPISITLEASGMRCQP